MNNIMRIKYNKLRILVSSLVLATSLFAMSTPAYARQIIYEDKEITINGKKGWKSYHYISLMVFADGSCKKTYELYRHAEDGTSTVKQIVEKGNMGWDYWYYGEGYGEGFRASGAILFIAEPKQDGSLSMGKNDARNFMTKVQGKYYNGAEDDYYNKLHPSTPTPNPTKPSVPQAQTTTPEVVQTTPVETPVAATYAMVPPQKLNNAEMYTQDMVEVYVAPKSKALEPGAITVISLLIITVVTGLAIGVSLKRKNRYKKLA